MRTTQGLLTEMRTVWGRLSEGPSAESGYAPHRYSAAATVAPFSGLPLTSQPILAFLHLHDPQLGQCRFFPNRFLRKIGQRMKQIRIIFILYQCAEGLFEDIDCIGQMP